MMARTNDFRVLVVLAVAALAAALLMLLAAGEPAKAAFPGKNGLLVFTSDRDTGPTSDDLYGMDATGKVVGEGDVRRLTTYAPINDPRPGVVQFPSVSPDGTKVAFLSNRYYPTDPAQPGQFQIYVMDLQDRDGDGNGDHRTCLTCETNDVSRIGIGYDTRQRISWSPDGSKIAFASNRTDPTDGTTDSDIWVINATNGSGLTNLTADDPAQDLGPVFSPDGTKIAYPSNRLDPADNTKDFDIWLRNADGSGTPTNLTNNAVPDLLPEFSPEGNRIAFMNVVLDSGVPVDRNIWVMNADGSHQTNVTNNGPDIGDIHPNWAIKK